MPHTYILYPFALFFYPLFSTLDSHFKYKVKEQHFIITIQRYENEVVPDAAATEKDTGTVEQYLANGRLFYIMSNNELLNAVWSDGQSLSLKVFGDTSIQNLKQLLDLIGA